MIRPGLRIEIGITLLVLTTLTASLIGVIMLDLMERGLLDQEQRSALHINQTLSQQLFSSDFETENAQADFSAFIEDEARELLEIFDVERLALFDERGHIWAEWSLAEQAGADEGATLPNMGEEVLDAQVVDRVGRGMAWVITRQLTLSQGDPIMFQTTHSLANSRVRLKSAQQLAVLYTALSGLFVVIIAYVLMTRMIVRPIRRVGLAAQHISEGDFARRVTVKSNNEIGLMAGHFNHMLDRLEEGRVRLQDKVRDLAEAKEALEAAQAEVISAEKLASVGRLSAGLAHEIGNPLSALISMVEVLKSGVEISQEEQHDLLGRVEGELMRIHRIVGELLDYSRRGDDDEETAHLEEEIQQIVDLVKSQPRFKTVDTAVSLDDRLPPVHLGAERLKQVLLNLLLNAADAMDEEGSVYIVGKKDAGGILLSVQDSGPGLSSAAAEHIFEPFFTTKPTGEGTGLGLSICERIVTVSGGWIKGENHPDGGAVFKVWLPVADKDKQ